MIVKGNQSIWLSPNRQVMLVIVEDYYYSQLGEHCLRSGAAAAWQPGEPGLTSS
jgi:hypothetical protein